MNDGIYAEWPMCFGLAVPLPSLLTITKCLCLRYYTSNPAKLRA